MSVKKTQDPIIVTPPKPLPIPSPTYSLEEGSQGTSEAEVVTEPKARFVGSTHEEIPEWPGPYHITENGLYECAGYEFSTNLLVEVPPKGLTEITIEENGVYKPDDYDGYSKVTVDVFSPTLETLNATENKTYTAPEGKAYDEVVVNVPVGGNTLKTLLDTTKRAFALFYNYGGTSVSDLISYDDTENVVNMEQMFMNCANLLSVPLLNTSKAKNINNAFSWDDDLTEIPAYNFSEATSFSNTFNGCNKLTAIHATGMKVDFNISASTQFTREALVEIITNCASVSVARTLTMGATNLAKLTQDDIDLATSKGWTLA